MSLTWLLLLLACRGNPGDSDTDGGEDTDTDSVPTTTACDLTEQIGLIGIMVEMGGAPQFSAQIYDAPDPWIGPPELSNDSCDYHAFSTDSCGGCDAGQVCSFDGECVAERRSLKDVTVTIRSGSDSETFEADPTTGLAWGEVPFGGPGTAYTFDVSFGDESFTVGPLVLADELEVAVTGEGTSEAPGAVSFDWTDPGADTYVTTRIPINHHAAGPTFTTCMAGSDEQHMRADAAMIEPLAVITGLEYQGHQHVSSAAVETESGCVDVRLGTHTYTSVTY